MEFLYGVKEGKVYKVAVVKETDKQVKLEEGNGTGRTVVKKSDIERVMGDKLTSVVFSTNEDIAKELWNAHIEQDVKELEELKQVLNSWMF